MSPSSPLLPFGPVHQPFYAWTSTYHKNTTSNHSDFKSMVNDIHFVQACVRLPYFLLKSPIIFNEFESLVSCCNCTLYTCLNPSILLNQSYESIYLCFKSWNSADTPPMATFP